MERGSWITCNVCFGAGKPEDPTSMLLPAGYCGTCEGKGQIFDPDAPQFSESKNEREIPKFY